jgi:hypothetical protein
MVSVAQLLKLTTCASDKYCPYEKASSNCKSTPLAITGDDEEITSVAVANG